MINILKDELKKLKDIIINTTINIINKINTINTKEKYIMAVTDVNKPEKIEIISTNKDTHFTEQILPNNYENEILLLPSGSKYIIHGISIQSKQDLKFKLNFYGSNSFENINMNIEKYIGSVELDLTNNSTLSTYGKYRLNIENLEMIYQDFTSSNKLYISLMNMSLTKKNSGIDGEIQINIKISPRL